jgi:hypothetical protein
MKAALTRLRRQRHTHRGDEAGVAMIMVVLLSMVLLLVPLAISTAVVGQLPLARHDQDYASAIAAAQAGAQDYINRLNANTLYWQTSLANTASNTPPNPSDGNKALTGWVEVSSLSPLSLLEGYCYTVDQNGSNGTFVTDSTISSTQGIVSLTVYGYSGAAGTLPAANPGANPCAGPIPARGVERVTNFHVRQEGFLDYLELTDLELVDQSWYNQQQGGHIADCYNGTYNGHTDWTAYNWSTVDHATDCGPLDNYWTTGNVLSGPVRTNDDYYLCGTPQFNAAIISDDPKATVGPNGGGTYWTDPASSCGADNPVFNAVATNAGGTIAAGAGQIQFPQTDSSVLTYGQAATGCYYVGPTDIQLLGLKMTVVSPLTTATTSPNNFAACVGTNINVPANGVIYVDNGTGNCAAAFGTNLDFWLTPALPQGDTCSSTHSPGDVFIQGTVTGGLTVVSADNVFITGDLTYTNGLATGSQDVLGIIANNYIEIDHAVDGSGNSILAQQVFHGSTKINALADYPGCGYNGSGQVDCNVVVDAALLSLSHSVGVQNYGKGTPFGTLTIHGALAQEYMDIEGVFSSGCQYTTQNTATLLCNGMNSVYSYDPRLAHLSPPHFLDPSYAQWKQLSFEECPTTGCQS